ncbi:hypothetical protein ABFV74_20120 [Pseudoalteromonas distincta]|uniref:hypothetical protein n=1 Tax=Pseudoalteromonas distincta TaxID=77608 RepID=UPI0032189B5A
MPAAKPVQLNNSKYTSIRQLYLHVKAWHYGLLSSDPRQKHRLFAIKPFTDRIPLLLAQKAQSGNALTFEEVCDMALRNRVDLGGFVYAFEYVTPEHTRIVYVGASTRTVDTRMKEHNREWNDDYKSEKFYEALSPYIGRDQVLSAHVKVIYSNFFETTLEVAQAESAKMDELRQQPDVVSVNTAPGGSIGGSIGMWLLPVDMSVKDYMRHKLQCAGARSSRIDAHIETIRQRLYKTGGALKLLDHDVLIGDIDRLVDEIMDPINGIGNCFPVDAAQFTYKGQLLNVYRIAGMTKLSKATVMSRCRAYNIAPGSTKEIQGLLLGKAKDSGLKRNTQRYDLLAAIEEIKLSTPTYRQDYPDAVEALLCFEQQALQAKQSVKVHGLSKAMGIFNNRSSMTSALSKDKLPEATAALLRYLQRTKLQTTLSYLGR